MITRARSEAISLILALTILQILATTENIYTLCFNILALSEQSLEIV